MKVDPNVRRVLVQIVDASCNSFARHMADKCRHMMGDEYAYASAPAGLSTAAAYYVAGRNDVLRELAKYFDSRIELRTVVETTSDVVGALVDDVRRDVP